MITMSDPKEKKQSETHWEYLQRTGEERLSSYDQERLQDMRKRWNATSTKDETESSGEDEEDRD